MPKPSSGPAKSPLVVKPLVRPPFPKLVPDRSPIVGLSSALSMRTCFRVGEAINVGSRAIREGVQVFIELYARVRSSYREPRGVKQHFVFVDLFHDHQPYLSGIQQNWKGVELWDRDSSKFLEPSDSPRMCRCMGQMKKEDNMWKLTVFNIWEATMDDVEYVFGIIKDSYQPETISNGFEHSFANWRTFFTNII
ncbi:uncharacterized protein K452DRAFT_237686 [Aplosporella prunicola CBS 121167]|uniref:Uncharacterized protein n=1 Tax=Aplosporella prunicola CBS 121167 TaxID=1176127 RepID=A0A6A6AYS7_9PEZI|nr:uncharacterized protein K452DRAFT_237686 [Aplosporella prunicola CBS 121167]KAF2136343.1 hypothetical protein K452DRAFT_237686 [Aplosporella prunicola CBS 121167]